MHLTAVSLDRFIGSGYVRDQMVICFVVKELHYDVFYFFLFSDSPVLFLSALSWLYIDEKYWFCLIISLIHFPGISWNPRVFSKVMWPTKSPISSMSKAIRITWFMVGLSSVDGQPDCFMIIWITTRNQDFYFPKNLESSELVSPSKPL